MPTTIKLKNSVTTTNAPSSLAQGEVAINITDKKVWVGNAATTPIQLVGDGGSASFTSIAFGAGSAANPSITFTGDTNTGIFSPAADTIAFTEGGTEAMRIDSSGNVGIGTNNPTTKLDIVGGKLQVSTGGNLGFAGSAGINLYTGAGANIRLYDDANSCGINTVPSGGASSLAFSTSGTTERMRITSGGNVGINTTTFSTGYLTIDTKAQVGIDIYRSDSTAQYNGIRFRNTTNTTTYGSLGWDSGGLRLDGDAGTMYFSTSGTERMRITSGGELLVGTTSANGRVTSDSTSGGTNQAFWGKNSGGAGAGTCVLWNATTTGNPIFVDFYTEAGATQRGTISYNRGTGQVSYNTTSDQRLKENIADASSALPKVNSIRIKSFDWKETGNHVDFGVIAQELITVAPECVTEGIDNEDGSIKSPWQVDTAALVPVLVKAIQELNAKVGAQAAEIALLKSK